MAVMVLQTLMGDLPQVRNAMPAGLQNEDPIILCYAVRKINARRVTIPLVEEYLGSGHKVLQQ